MMRPITCLTTPDGRTGLHVGVWGDVPVGAGLYIRAQLLYSNKGATHTSSQIATKKTRVRMNYLELPIQLAYKHKTSFGTLYGGLGPYFAYAINGNLEQNEETKKMFTDEIQNWRRDDIGLSIAAGVEFNNRFTAGVRINAGMRDVYEHEAAEIKNRCFSLTAGYRL